MDLIIENINWVIYLVVLQIAFVSFGVACVVFGTIVRAIFMGEDAHKAVREIFTGEGEFE